MMSKKRAACVKEVGIMDDVEDCQRLDAEK